MIVPIKKGLRYQLVYSKDPALELAEDEKERENQLRVARETGAWADLVAPGKAPTIFHMRALDRDRFQRWASAHDRRGNPLARTLYGFMLLGRMALVEVENFDKPGTHKLKRVIDPEFQDLGDLAEPFNNLDNELADHLAYELGDCVFQRETITLPK